jgi:hypothetical protein
VPNLDEEVRRINAWFDLGKNLAWSLALIATGSAAGAVLMWSVLTRDFVRVGETVSIYVQDGPKKYYLQASSVRNDGTRSIYGTTGQRDVDWHFRLERVN